MKIQQDNNGNRKRYCGNKITTADMLWRALTRVVKQDDLAEMLFPEDVTDKLAYIIDQCSTPQDFIRVIATSQNLLNSKQEVSTLSPGTLFHTSIEDIPGHYMIIKSISDDLSVYVDMIEDEPKLGRIQNKEFVFVDNKEVK